MPAASKIGGLAVLTPTSKDGERLRQMHEGSQEARSSCALSRTITTTSDQQKKPSGGLIALFLCRRVFLMYAISISDEKQSGGLRSMIDNTAGLRLKTQSKVSPAWANEPI
jgi:hypothetical protein